MITLIGIPLDVLGNRALSPQLRLRDATLALLARRNGLQNSRPTGLIVVVVLSILAIAISSDVLTLGAMFNFVSSSMQEYSSLTYRANLVIGLISDLSQEERSSFFSSTCRIFSMPEIVVLKVKLS